MITEADLAKLTHRQREVLTALARQLSSDEVARLLHIAEATLKIDMAAFRMRFSIGRAPTPMRLLTKSYLRNPCVAFRKTMYRSTVYRVIRANQLVMNNYTRGPR